MEKKNKLVCNDSLLIFDSNWAKRKGNLFVIYNSIVDLIRKGNLRTSEQEGTLGTI